MHQKVLVNGAPEENSMISSSLIQLKVSCQDASLFFSWIDKEVQKSIFFFFFSSNLVAVTALLSMGGKKTILMMVL